MGASLLAIGGPEFGIHLGPIGQPLHIPTALHRAATNPVGASHRVVDAVAFEQCADQADGKTIAGADDLLQWEQMLRHMAPGISRAAEYPLQADDLQQLTTEHVAVLARLGQPRLEHAHV